MKCLKIVMRTLLHSVLALFPILGANQAASAHLEYTIYVDTSHDANIGSGMIGADCDEADRNTR
jgi:hypothetical protein